MYGYIIGTVTEIEASYIILENNKIGYIINVPNPYSFTLNSEYKIYIYTQIKEDEHLLYGFKELSEKELFLKLIGVKGLGPKMALPMLATGSQTGIMDAIDIVNTNNELVEVLTSLGYKNNDIKKILPSIDSTKEIEEQIKDALKLMLK